MRENETNDIEISNKSNKTPAEMIRQKEYTNVDERQFADERVFVKEFAPSKNKVKIQKTTKTVLTTFLVGAVAVSSIINIPNYIEDKNLVSDYSIYAYDYGVSYYFVFDETLDYSNLIINVYNDFVKFSEPVKDNVIEYTYTDLKPNMEYNISITRDGRTVFKKSFITKSGRSDATNGGY